MNILVTGSNRGIGLEFVKQYLNSGNVVIASCRNPKKAEELAQLYKEFEDNMFIIELDVTNEISRQKAFEEINEVFDSLDLLINNAGVVAGHGENLIDSKKIRLGKLHSEDMCKVFQTNTIAPLLITEKFLDLLKNGDNPKIINISAKMGSFGSKDYGGYYSYSASKAALNMVTNNLALDLKRKKITVVSLYPHWNQTRMGGAKADNKPDESVSKIVKTIDQLELDDTGKFIDGFNGEYLEW